MPGRRLPAYPVWLAYTGVWAFVGSLSWTTAAVFFIRDVDMTPLQLVLTGTALEVGYFLFEIPTGVVADMYSRRLSLIVAAVVSGIAMIITGATHSAGVVIAAAALWGVGWTFRSGAEDAWLADELGQQRLGSAYQRSAQLARIAGLLGIGGAVALAVVDLRLPFLAAGSVTFFLAVFLAVAMPEHGFTRPARSSGTSHLGAAATTARDGGRLVRAHPILMLVLAIAFVTGMWAEGFDRLWEAHLLLEVGLPDVAGLGDVVWFGLIGAGSLVLSFAVAAPLVTRIERLGQESLARFLLLLHGLLILTALAFAWSATVWVALVAYWATTVVRGLTEAPFRTWLNGAVADSRVRATVLSISGVTGSAGEWAGGPVLGVVGNRWSVRAALGVGAFLLTPTLALFARAGRHYLGDQPQTTGTLVATPKVKLRDVEP
jgi:DHA3 family tetracycline resistance protein-like MFS transporter